MRADPDVQMAKAKPQAAATWSGTKLVCTAVQRGKNTELCGYDHAPVTGGRMRAQYPLPHGPPPSPLPPPKGCITSWLTAERAAPEGGAGRGLHKSRRPPSPLGMALGGHGRQQPLRNGRRATVWPTCCATLEPRARDGVCVCVCVLCTINKG